MMYLIRASNGLRLKHMTHCRHITTSSSRSRFVPAFDPYHYTQGRWLDRDDERRDARTLHFDFDALLDTAVESSAGAREVLGCEKKEGGFNRVFLISLDNGRKVVARLPTRLAGPPRLTLSSEVATLAYVREKTTIPIPKVLAWSAEPENNPVGAEYMIMDAVPGVALNAVWGQMSGVQHLQCIQSISKVAQALCRLDFPAFGSLYFNTADRPTRALPLDDKYCLGPVCAPQHWGLGVGKSGIRKEGGEFLGPWQEVASYLSDLTSLAGSVVTRRGDDKQASVDHHLRLLDLNQRILRTLTDTDTVKAASNPTLFHPDFHTRNIFVDTEDPTEITGIIDWQSAAIEPAFVHAAETPDFAEELPFDRVLGANRASEPDEAQADSQRCAQAWAVLAYVCPKLGQAISLDPLLCRYLAAGSSGWLDDSLSLRSLLTDMGDRWQELGLPDDRMYQPSHEDTKALEVELDERESTQRLRMYLARLLGCETDGWVRADKWDEILPRYREQYGNFVHSCVESREEGESESEAVEKAQRLWLYDLR